jgi:hypothetical protein
VPKLLVYIALGFVLWTLWSSNVQPTSTVAGKEPIPYKPTHLGGWKQPTDVEGVLTIRNRAGDPVAEYVLGDDGVLHQDPEQRANGLYQAEFRPDDYAGRWITDVGAWAAYDTELRLGIRYSPVRVFYGFAAPDIVASESAIGLGISLYPPKRSAGFWHHFGVGVWLTHDLDRGTNAVSFGLSSSVY